MNKKELIDAVSVLKPVATKSQIGAILEGFIEVVGNCLTGGGKVNLSGFGNFSRIERKARQGRNPRTGEPVEIPASKTVKFTPGKGLKGKVRG